MSNSKHSPRGIGGKIIQLRDSGKTYDEIVEILNCSKNTINYHCKKAGLTNIGFSPVKISREIAKSIYEFFQNNPNAKLSEGVKKFDLSLSTIKKYKKEGESSFEKEESHEE